MSKVLALEKPRSPGGQGPPPVGQAQQLQHPFGVVGQLIEFLIAGGGIGKLDELHLIELMLADEAAGIPAGAARLGAEAGGIGAVFNGQAGAVENFIPMHIGDRHLGGGNEEIVGIGQLEGVLLELGKLAGARSWKPG